jgi:hypothetical protein
MRRTVNEIRGNVSHELKEAVVHLHSSVGFKPDGFARAIMSRVELVSVDFFTDSDPNKKEAVVVSEIEVTEGTPSQPHPSATSLIKFYRDRHV